MSVGVVGLGKLGLPLLALLANSGYQVVGYDKSSSLIQSLRDGNCPYPEPGLFEFLKLGNENIEYVDSIDSLVSQVEVLFIIVPTPSLDDGKFSNQALLEVCNEVGTSLKKNPKVLTIDIVSTVMPGSCEGAISETLEDSSGMKIGDQLGLCYNPEFIALGSVIRDMQYPDMQLLGANNDFHASRVEAVLKSIVRKEVPVKRMSLSEAELVKISVNNFVTMKISFANMLGELASKVGNINIDVVTEAIGLDSRIGTKYLRAGAPFGGPCFPRDTKALSALLKDFSITASLPDMVDSVNTNFGIHLKQLIEKHSNKNGVIGILGLSYKPDTHVIEESPGVAIVKNLAEAGHKVCAWDPLVRELPFEHANIEVLENLDDFIQNADFVAITRPVPEVDKSKIEVIKKTKQYLDFWRLA